jgi:hypothetical protein
MLEFARVFRARWLRTQSQVDAFAMLVACTVACLLILASTIAAGCLYWG